MERTSSSATRGKVRLRKVRGRCGARFASSVLASALALAGCFTSTAVDPAAPGTTRPAPVGEAVSEVAQQFVASHEGLLLADAPQRRAHEAALLDAVTPRYRQEALEVIADQEARRVDLERHENVFDEIRTTTSVRGVEQPAPSKLLVAVTAESVRPYRQISGQPPAWGSTSCWVMTLVAAGPAWQIDHAIELDPMFGDPPDPYRAVAEHCA